MRRPVNHARLHGGDAFVPTIGGLGSTLPPTTKNYNMTMFLTDLGLLVKIKEIESLIPLANIQLMVFSGPDEDVKKTKA